jgi:hypothetical protein
MAPKKAPPVPDWMMEAYSRTADPQRGQGAALGPERWRETARLAGEAVAAGRAPCAAAPRGAAFDAGAAACALDPDREAVLAQRQLTRYARTVLSARPAGLDPVASTVVVRGRPTQVGRTGGVDCFGRGYSASRLSGTGTRGSAGPRWPGAGDAFQAWAPGPRPVGEGCPISPRVSSLRLPVSPAPLAAGPGPCSRLICCPQLKPIRGFGARARIGPQHLGRAVPLLPLAPAAAAGGARPIRVPGAAVQAGACGLPRLERPTRVGGGSPGQHEGPGPASLARPPSLEWTPGGLPVDRMC